MSQSDPVRPHREHIVDCFHEGQPHLHGTTTAYRADKCRCTSCYLADSSARRKRRQQQADGWNPRSQVDAVPARKALDVLASRGMTATKVASLIGCSPSSIRRIRHGAPTTSALYAKKLLELANIEQVNPTARRLRSLARCGWVIQQVATRTGMPMQVIAALTTYGHLTVHPEHERIIKDAYVAMIDVDPCAQSEITRATSMRRMHFAKKQGWTLPIEWDAEHEMPLAKVTQTR